MAKKNKLDDYRLSFESHLGFKWQDKRDGDPDVYKRHFFTVRELENFISEYFGKREWNRIFKENKELLSR